MYQVIEVDTSSGAGAIALLIGVVLLLRERTRSKRSSRKDENLTDT